MQDAGDDRGTRLPGWATAAENTSPLAVTLRGALAVVSTPVFVAVAITLRQFHVLVLLLIVLVAIAFLGSGESLLTRYPVLGNIKLLGGALRVTGALDQHYREHRPRSFFLYAVYPLYALIGSVVSRTVRREVLLHARVVGVVAIVLVLDALFGYFTVYPPYLGPDIAALLLLLQLVLVLGFSSVYLMPMLTTVYTIALSGRKTTMRVVVGLSLLLSVFSGGWAWANTQEVLPYLDQVRLSARLRSADFRHDLDDLAEMFLDYSQEHGWLVANVKPAVDGKATLKFRSLVRGVVSGVEYRSFDVISFTVAGKTWGGIRAFLGRRVLLLYLRAPDGKMIKRSAQMPKAVRALFRIGEANPGRHRADVVSAGLIDDIPLK